MAIYRVPVTISNSNLPNAAANVFHVRTVAGSEDPGPAIAALRAWYNSLASYLATGTTVTFPDVVVDVTSDTEFEVASPSAPVTSLASVAESMGLAVVVAWKTSIRARRGRGRTYFGPVSDNAQDTATGRVKATAVTAFGTATTTLVNASLAGSGWSLGVWGQESAGLAEPKVLRDWTGFTVNPKFGYLRSRRD